MRLARLAVCIVVTFPVEFVCAQAPGTSAEEAAIRDTARAFVAAYDAGDAAAIAALWTKDGEYVLGQTTLNGQPAIQKAYEEFFKAHPGSKMEVHIDSIKVLAPTVAVEHGTASVSGSPNGLPSASAYQAIHVKQDGNWRMASVRESTAPVTPRHELRELAWLVGKWTARGEAATVDVKYEWIADQHFIRGETTVRAKGAATIVPGGTQIIGRDPVTGQIVSWFFHADGGRGSGVWVKDGNRWMIDAQGVTADAVPTAAMNVLYQADERTMSWRSMNRIHGDQVLPNTSEVVLERVTAASSDEK